AAVVICSPWVTDVELPALAASPYAAEIPRAVMPSENRLSALLGALTRTSAPVILATLSCEPSGIRPYLTKTPDHARMEDRLLSLLTSQGITVLSVDGLHAKIVATQHAAIVGSANLTHAGVYQNRELSWIMSRHLEVQEHDTLGVTLPQLLV